MRCVSLKKALHAPHYSSATEQPPPSPPVNIDKKGSSRMSGKSPMNHQSIQMNSAAELAPARLATSRLLPERALQANNRNPQDSPASSLPQNPLQRGTISNFCSPCGRLLAGDLYRANATQPPRKKKVLQAFLGNPR
jgi:hypothetical protein